MLDFEPITAQTLGTGDTIHLAISGEEVTSWDCVIPCIVIGHQDGQPVLQAPGGPKVNDGELLPEGSLRTRGKPGQVPIEVLTLGFYKQVQRNELKGKTIAYVDHDFFGPSIIICEDKTYSKVLASPQEGGTFQEEPLTIYDLRYLGLIDVDEMATFEEQQAAAREVTERKQGEAQLQKAISTLGASRAKAIVDLHILSNQPD